MRISLVVAFLFFFVAFIATCTASYPPMVCLGMGCDQTPDLGQNAQGQGQLQGAATISQAGGTGNYASINIYNGYGSVPTSIPVPTLSPAPKVPAADHCHLDHEQFKSAVDAFFWYTLTAKENRYLTLATGADIFGYDKFLSQVDGVYMGSFDLQDNNQRATFIAKVRSLSDVAMIEVCTLQYGWVVVVYTLNDNGKIVECREIDTNPENGIIRIQNPEGWLQVEGRGGTINIPNPANRYQATDIRQIE